MGRPIEGRVEAGFDECVRDGAATRTKVMTAPGLTDSALDVDTSGELISCIAFDGAGIPLQQFRSASLCSSWISVPKLPRKFRHSSFVASATAASTSWGFEPPSRHQQLPPLAHDPSIVGIMRICSRNALHGGAPCLSVLVICGKARRIEIQ
jgi:hypothetical protein